MVAMLRTWWQNTSKTLKIVQIIILVATIALIVSFIGGYFFNWTWTGFGPYTPPTSNFQREKTLYDWLQLAIIPVGLAFGVWWLARLQQQRDQQLADQRAKSEREAAEKHAQAERNIALDNQGEAALQVYIDNISALLLERNLRKSGEDDEVRKIARVITITTLKRLDVNRKGSVLQFLRETGLITRGIKDDGIGDDSIISLYQADLRGANLGEAFLLLANLSNTDLRGANLNGAVLDAAHLGKANLGEADLSETTLLRADLHGANLNGATLRGANLSYADLRETNVTSDQLAQAKSLEHATMPDGSQHP
jgi:hypothetical protein